MVDWSKNFKNTIVPVIIAKQALDQSAIIEVDRSYWFLSSICIIQRLTAISMMYIRLDRCDQDSDTSIPFMKKLQSFQASATISARLTGNRSLSPPAAARTSLLKRSIYINSNTAAKSDLFHFALTIHSTRGCVSQFHAPPSITQPPFDSRNRNSHCAYKTKCVETAAASSLRLSYS